MLMMIILSFDLLLELNFLDHQSEINSQMRTILVDWLVEVADEYKLNDETLFLCIQYVDRFLSTVNVTRSKLQLLGRSRIRPLCHFSFQSHRLYL